MRRERRINYVVAHQRQHRRNWLRYRVRRLRCQLTSTSSSFRQLWSDAVTPENAWRRLLLPTLALLSLCSRRAAPTCNSLQPSAVLSVTPPHCSRYSPVKPKFHDAYFHRNFPAGKVVDTNHESRRHDLCPRLSPRGSFDESRKVGVTESGLCCTTIKKVRVALSRKPTAELRNVTCHVAQC